MLFLTLGTTFDESNPLSFSVVLLMVFLLVVLSFLLPLMVLFLSLGAAFGESDSPLYYYVGDGLHLMVLNLELWNSYWWSNH